MSNTISLKEFRWLQDDLLAAREREARAQANLDYVAMMTDVEIPTEEGEDAQ